MNDWEIVEMRTVLGDLHKGYYIKFDLKHTDGLYCPITLTFYIDVDKQKALLCYWEEGTESPHTRVKITTPKGVNIDLLKTLALLTKPDN